MISSIPGARPARSISSTSLRAGRPGAPPPGGGGSGRASAVAPGPETSPALALRVRVQLIGHARNNMEVNLSHAWL